MPNTDNCTEEARTPNAVYTAIMMGLPVVGLDRGIAKPAKTFAPN